MPANAFDDPNIGLQLRRLRELRVGRWQWPMTVPPGSVTLCLGASSMHNDFVTEILARVLKEQRVDARSVSVDDLHAPTPPAGAVPESVAIVFIVISSLDTERESCTRLVARARALSRRLPWWDCRRRCRAKAATTPRQASTWT